MADKQGMVGGFLSQSVVMPELDGGIVPMAINAQFIDDEGLYLFRAIPGRAEQFASTVSNYLRLRTKANSQKKIAIYYFKGPGSHSLVAAGLEVLPSLYNFLKALQSEGYDLSGLPATEEAFERLVMERGPVFNSYAEGNIDRYLRSGYPEMVATADYDRWLHCTLAPEQYASLTGKHGAAPGPFYTTGDSIAVTRIRFGNVVLLPQPTQSTGENSFAAVHGDNPIPPHHYIVSYLWTRYGFGADAMIHFGTHGSLEFIPGKQVALSTADSCVMISFKSISSSCSTEKLYDLIPNSSCRSHIARKNSGIASSTGIEMVSGRSSLILASRMNDCARERTGPTVPSSLSILRR